jgi:hydrogenase maturation protease
MRRLRVLCLGNDLVADDGVGISAARAIRHHLPDVEVIEEAASGLYLLDVVIGVDQLVVVDAIMTGAALPGTVHLVGETDMEIVPGISPHYVGLFETLDLARALDLDAPDDVSLICVEIRDAVTIGGAMTDEVRRAIPEVVDVIAAVVAGNVVA